MFGCGDRIAPDLLKPGPNACSNWKPNERIQALSSRSVETKAKCVWQAMAFRLGRRLRELGLSSETRAQAKLKQL